jgi:hypothetical protein
VRRRICHANGGGSSMYRKVCRKTSHRNEAFRFECVSCVKIVFLRFFIITMSSGDTRVLPALTIVNVLCFRFLKMHILS